jgi:rhodanese-related sulfurtransferase
MKYSQIEKAIKTLVRKYPPFNRLSAERMEDIVDMARFFVLQKGEFLQLTSSAKSDYLYLIEGRLDIQMPNGTVSLLNETDHGNKPFTLPANIEQCKLRALDDVMACHIDRSLLDKMISWDEVVQQHANDVDQELASRLRKIRNCLLLRSLPLEHVETVFQRMQTVNVKKGDVVIRQGEQGDKFYIIGSGNAEVWETGLYDDEPRMTEIIGEGGTFGNHALVTGQPNNKTVKMIEDGELLVLNKQDFDEIIHRKMIKTVNSKIAQTMLENGYRLLDVRYTEEYEDHHIPGAQLIPLPDLHKRVHELDPLQQYVVYCHSGNRSALAVMFLAQHNIEAFSLNGGIRDWPYASAGLYGEFKDRRTGKGCRRLL